MSAVKNLLMFFMRFSRTKLLVVVLSNILLSFLDTLTIGLVIPLLGVLLIEDLSNIHPFLSDLLVLAGNPERPVLIISAAFALLLGFTAKTLTQIWATKKRFELIFLIKEQTAVELLRLFIFQKYHSNIHKPSSELIKNLTAELNIFIERTVVGSTTLFAEVFLIGLITATMLVVDFTATLILFVIGFAFGYLLQLFSKNKIQKLANKRQVLEGVYFQKIQESLQGIRELVIFQKEQEIVDEYAITNALFHQTEKAVRVAQELPRILIEFCAVTVLCILIIMLTLKASNPSNIVYLLGVFAVCSYRVLPSVNKVLVAIQSIRISMPAFNFIKNELESSAAFTNPQNKLIKFKTKIELRNINFSYEGEKFDVLQNVNFTLLKGKIVGIFGKSGAGKSTLIDILIGLNAPNSGEIKIDGKLVNKKHDNWKHLIGYVPQTTYLFNRSIQENITLNFTDTDIDERSLKDAIDCAGLRELVDANIKGVNTQIGERGSLLSGGQRQRISIARALYRKPSILLLDEATSSLDLKTEKLILDSLHRLKADTTIVIVSHRRSTLEICDSLYKLENKTLSSVRFEN